MSKKSKKSEQEEAEQEFHGQEEVPQQELQMSGETYIELKVSLLNMAKDLLQQNAAMKWEIEKKYPKEITCDEVVEEAHKLLNFVLG